MKSTTFQRILIEQAGNGIKSELKPKRFLQLKISLPSINEQLEIVKRINAINLEVEELKDLAKQNENLLIKLRLTILREAVQGKLTEEWRKQNPNVEPAKELLKQINLKKEQLIKEKKLQKEKLPQPIKPEEIPFEIPVSWEWCRFSEIATIASNLVEPESYLSYPHIAPDSIEKGTGELLSYRTVEEDKLISAKHLFFPGQILYSKIRPHLNKVVEIDIEGLCSADMYPINCYIERSYLFRFMLSEIFVEQAMKSEGRVAMPKINQNELSNILVSVPPSEEQRKIIDFINSILDVCKELKQQIIQNKEDAEQLIQSILSELLGDQPVFKPSQNNKENIGNASVRDIIYDSKSTLMELVELLKKYGKLHAEDLWKMSKFPSDIDAFYAELKKQIEVEKIIKEVENEKGYLELA